MLLKDIVSINNVSIIPQKYSNVLFYCYSLPAFDNSRKPECLFGSQILSNKFLINKNSILFNKLNVRFKRIWNIKSFKENSICSTEYFPLIVKNINYLQDYIYYYLISDKLNKLLMQDINGTSSSHQRIEFATLINQSVPEHSLIEQQHIVNILGSIDDKIENNESIHRKLLNILDFLYLYETSHSDIVKLGEFIENFDSQRKPLSSREREKIKGIYPYYGATEAMDYINKYNFDGSYILLAEDGTVMDKNEKPIVQYVDEKFWPNNHTHVLRGVGRINNNLLYLILRNTNIKKAITGAVQLKINQANLNNLEIKLPKNTNNFINIIEPYFKKLFQIKNEIKLLNHLKQLYLKKFFG